MGFFGIPVCKLCKGEKHRVSTKAGYRYVCHCKEWRVRLKILEKARQREERRRR